MFIKFGADVFSNPIIVFLSIIWVHWFADFFMQSGYMANNKSSSNQWLSFKSLGLHVSVYSIFFIPIGGLLYAGINLILHYLTDYVTSRWSKRLREQEKIHEFFVVIGFDQAIHMTCLVLTYELLIGF